VESAVTFLFVDGELLAELLGVGNSVPEGDGEGVADGVSLGFEEGQGGNFVAL
jgi:hypothetical protein